MTTMIVVLVPADPSETSLGSVATSPLGVTIPLESLIYALPSSTVLTILTTLSR